MILYQYKNERSYPAMNGLTNLMAGFKADESANNIIDMMAEAMIAADIRDEHLAAISAAKESSVDIETPDFSDVDESLDPMMLDITTEDADYDDIMDDDEFDDFDVDSLPEGDEDDIAETCKKVTDENGTSCEAAIMHEIDAILA